MTSINIHDSNEIIPEINVSDEGRGWITFRVKRKSWFDRHEMETVEMTMFTEDIAKLSSDLSEALREGISQMTDDLAEKELAL